MKRARLLANEYTVLYESPDPESIYCYNPGIGQLQEGRLIGTFDLSGPGAGNLPATGRWEVGEWGYTWVARITTSDDGGQTWVHRADFPGQHQRPFAAGDSLYVLGHAGDLLIMRSDDRGETWSEPVRLTTGQAWHQSACNVHYANGNVYLVMERRLTFEVPGWPVSELAPVLMRAPLDADLTQRESWTFASELALKDLLGDEELDYFGTPFWNVGDLDPGGGTSRVMWPIGWLETNVVQFVDPDHVWYDPTGHTFHLWMRAHTGGTGYACILKVIEHEDGSMATMPETAPSGRRMIYIPCPGGQMRFHVLYDEKVELYWLLSTLAWDSMTKPERLSPNRFWLPNNERHVLALHFSRNMVDWRMAGVVAQGNNPKEARHYASMLIDGDDLLVLSRSGDHRAKNAHDGNLITLHRVPDFRELIY
jgi:hypothetical protein